MDRREMKRALKRLGITQASIARRIGRHQTSVSNCLNGRFKSRPILAAVEAAIAEKEKGEPDVHAQNPDADGPPSASA